MKKVLLGLLGLVIAAVVAILVFFKRDAMARLQEVAFKKAYCVSLEEEFDAISDVPMQKRLVISANSIQIGDMNFENKWGA